MSENNSHQKPRKNNNNRNNNSKSRSHKPVKGPSVEDLRAKPLDELVTIATELNIEHPNDLKR
ncbi:MAG: transcription termination factor Rho, partial [Campylobacterales bacterium]